MVSIIPTYHYKERATERAPEKDLSFVNNTFLYIVKLMKKNRIRPRAGNTPGTFTVLYRGFVYVYEKKDWNYILITFYDIKQFKEANHVQYWKK